MLGRYRIVRGKRDPADPLPDGVRIDIRKHTGHVLRPEPEMVELALARPDDDAAWRGFAAKYRALVERRFAEDPQPFVSLAEQARAQDVFLGCSCPTQKQPDVHRCHTVLALHFMRDHFDDLDVRFP